MSAGAPERHTLFHSTSTPTVVTWHRKPRRMKIRYLIRPRLAGGTRLFPSAQCSQLQQFDQQGNTNTGSLQVLNEIVLQYICCDFEELVAGELYLLYAFTTLKFKCLILIQSDHGVINKK